MHLPPEADPDPGGLEGPGGTNHPPLSKMSLGRPDVQDSQEALGVRPPGSEGLGRSEGLGHSKGPLLCPGGKGGLCGSERGRLWGESSPAGFVCSGRPESLGRGRLESIGGWERGQASLGTGQGPCGGSWPGGAPSQGSKITTPICTQISKHKTPKRGHSKPKAAANHLFRFISFN